MTNEFVPHKYFGRFFYLSNSGAGKYLENTNRALIEPPGVCQKLVYNGEEIIL